MELKNKLKIANAITARLSSRLIELHLQFEFTTVKSQFPTA